MTMLETLRTGDSALMRMVRFVVVGGTATAIYFFLALACVAMGLGVEAAHVVAFVVSIVASYFGQKLVTFRVKGRHRRNASRFVIATAGIAAVQFGLVAYLKFMNLDPFFIFLVSSLYYPIASFIVHSLWTFRQTPSELDRPTRSG